MSSFAGACVLLACLSTGALAAPPPDPLARGPYAPVTLDPVNAGTVALQEPAANGNPPAGASAAVTVQARGSLYYPGDRASGSPVIVLVHGNHGSCQTGSAPNCTIFKRNDRGYAYLGENLATWGYTVFSIDQDQLIFYQDGTARGMHQRRLLIAAVLDALYAANQAPVPVDADHNIGAALVGKLDFSRIGLMGHSRGGDAVSSFLDFNRARPAPGRRYTGLRGVISLAPTDYERKAPSGVAYMTYVGYCDGDVSNLMGTRFYERSQYIDPDDPYPRMQAMLHGANHNWFNTVWFMDADDSTTSDPACSTNATANPNNIRLSGTNPANPYTRSGAAGSFGSGDPTLMGDQERAGLAVMGSFFRRYVGGELAFDPYETAELSADGVTPQLPATACPSLSDAGTRISCFDRFQQDYFAPPAERRDVIRPEPDDPLSLSALGTAITGSGFSNPYLAAGGVTPLPATTPGGYDWCNPEPNHFTPTASGEPGNPTAFKACPLPAAAGLGGQNGTRENAPVNHSYGLQFALAWDAPASLQTRIPADSGDVTSFKALTLGAAVNYFDPRNPPRGTVGLWNPAATTQDFDIVLTDSAGHSATVAAASPRYGTALHQTVGNVTVRVHVVLNSIRVPLSDFAVQGVDLAHVRKLELRFGGPGRPATGSIELADVRFQESVTGPTAARDAQAAQIAAQRVEATPRAKAEDVPDVVWIDAGTATATAGGPLDAHADAPASLADADSDAPATTAALTPAIAPAPACPTARITSLRVRGGRLTMTGTASTAARCVGKVKTVLVRIYQRSGSRCRFVRSSGRLGSALPCSSPVALVAHGTQRWSLKLARRLAKGAYRVEVGAIDAAGHERATAAQTSVRVR
jgi:hypothetical protein